MILGIIFLIISQIVLIPIVFNVHKTNNRVLSLFGIIPTTEIRELAIKCEKFTTNFLEDKLEKKDGENEEEAPQQNAGQTNANPNQENLNNNSNLEINNE